MKISLTYLKNHLVCLGAAVFLLVSINAAKADGTFLLTVDVTHANAVVITATGADSVANVDAFLADGVDLLGLFTSTTGPVTFTINTGVSNLTSSDNTGGDAYTDSLSDVMSGSNVDLNLYNYTSGANEDFTTSAAAFTGALTIDLSGSESLLRQSGTGIIKTGFQGSASPNVEIGSYQIITTSTPEPSTWALLLGGVALLAICRPRFMARRLQSAKL